MATSSNVSQTTQSGQTGSSGTSATLPKDNYKPMGNRYFGALVLLAAFIPLPFLAALITLIVYLSHSPEPAVAFFNWLGPGNIVIIILGLIITLVLWLLLAIPCQHFATAKSGRPSDYAKLQRNYKVLKKQLEVVMDAANTATRTAHDKATIADIEGNLANYNDMLNRNGLPWVLYTGYVSMWDQINKVDEAIVCLLPRETVIESANYDKLRLKDSDDPEFKDLLTLLDKAINTLSSDSKCSKQSSGQNLDCELQQNLAQAMYAILKKAPDMPSPSAANNGQVSQQSEQEARADIRTVKSALHNFTNERWDGQVRARNQFMGTAFLTAVFTYILVIIAILANVLPMNTIHAMVFYFLGAIVGLFGRLFDERNADKVFDDYGLSMIRIMVTPLISGLAALVGILILTSAQATIYEFTLPNLIFAAVLGYAPNILIHTLQSKSEEIKDQLKSASPSDQMSGKGSSGSSKASSNAGSG
jgi:hypothetical protein